MINKYTDKLTFKCICARNYKLQFYTAIATKSDSNSTSTFPIFYYAAKPAGGSTWTFSYMVSNEINGKQQGPFDRYLLYPLSTCTGK